MIHIAPKKSKVYKASNMLQQKVGAGPLDPKVVAKMQDAIDNNDVDFTPMGLEFLEQLEDAIRTIESGDPHNMSEHKEALTAPVMQLKANGAIFHYPLIGNLSNVMLSFLESIQEIDKDAMDVIEAHHKTLRAIISKRMSGDGGDIGTEMVKELRDACGRYYAKKKRKS